MVVAIIWDINNQPIPKQMKKQKKKIAVPKIFLNRSGPMIVLMNSKGWRRSNFILPGGSERGGKLFGESLPSPFNFSLASFNGRISMLRHTYPWMTGLLALSLTKGLYT